MTCRVIICKGSEREFWFECLSCGEVGNSRTTDRAARQGWKRHVEAAA